MAASGAHARQASVNEPSGARFFSSDRGSWRAIRAGTGTGAPSAVSHSCHLRGGRATPSSATCPVSCRRSAPRVCRGVSVSATTISANTSVVRRRFSGRDSSGAPRRSCLIFVLMLSSDQSGRIAFRVVVGPPRATGARSNVLHCPINATTHDEKVPTREGSNENPKVLEQSSSAPSSSPQS